MLRSAVSVFALAVAFAATSTNHALAVVIDNFGTTEATPAAILSPPATQVGWNPTGGPFSTNESLKAAEILGDVRQTSMFMSTYGGIDSSSASINANLTTTRLNLNYATNEGTFYLAYNGASAVTNANLAGLSGPGMSGLGGFDLTQGGAEGILIRNLATSSVSPLTLGVTLFDAAGTASRTIYHQIAASTASTDYFFSFVNWHGPTVSASDIGAIVLSFASSGLVTLGGSQGTNSIETVSLATAVSEGAVIITPEPASIAIWSGLMLIGCCVFLVRRKAASPVAAAA